ncbi:hypothetical protein [Actinophytocola gossypii]|uniref:Capsular polysaccharide biosynthesis protein n=1 Tax=Actinophytocola gossypii TaxID=2812003 RepID=A0ABT2J2A4_9PSEU|nr:hypothetical protein [Actinophytocola gossypii]MCT2581993.1 hypothetical protein [Actinophytocola gossypii]
MNAATRTPAKPAKKTTRKAAPKAARNAVRKPAQKVTTEETLRSRLVAAWPRVTRRLGRPVTAGVVAAVLAGGGVLLATALAGEEYEGRVSLVATPVGGASGAQYGEVVALTLPALVELARGPSVLAAAAGATGTDAETIGEGVSVELVPASGVARLAVLAPSADQAGAVATAIARAVVDADLLAPAAALRLLDERPDVIQVSPDRPLGVGLALGGAALAGVTVGGLRHLRRTSDVAAVRAAVGSWHPVLTLRADEPDLPERLTRLCDAAGRTPRVVPVAEELAPAARSIEDRLPERAGDGDAVILVTSGGRRQEQLAAVARVLPVSSTVVAVVLA